MTSTVLAAMLAAAVLHATWNAWVKSRPDPYGAIVALSIGAGWPCVLLLVWQGLPEHTAWGWIAITIALSVPAQALLGSAYREGDFVVAYPVVRGMNPVVIALGSVALFGERLSLANSLGVVCVSAGIALPWRMPRKALRSRPNGKWRTSRRSSRIEPRIPNSFGSTMRRSPSTTRR